ncbi:MAG: hypothetical protein KKC76_16800 [Proteobacteria bacterium]|nr:hypothetical protein [Pseudomonadota bacterium]MBU4294753.1 hypothetical protein [Pseudomonadota bacterium]MCG2749799.1 hypothetical protein [Desulfobulbaceae bacterium]
MKKHICNNCGCRIQPGGLLYNCRTEIISGFDNYIPDAEEDGDELIREACANMTGRSPEELSAQVYEEISFILCPVCRQKIRKQLLALQVNRLKKDKILLFPPRV